MNIPTDEEIAQIGRATDPAAWDPDWYRLPDYIQRRWIAAIRAIREAVEAPLMERIAELEAEVREHRQHVSTIMKRQSASVDPIASAETVEQLAEMLYKKLSNGGAWKWESLRIECKEDLQSAVTAILRARVVVPEGVPTAQDVSRCVTAYVGGTESDNMDVAHAILADFAPYLQQPANVDPALCEMEFDNSWFTAKGRDRHVSIVIPQKNGDAIVGTMLTKKAGEFSQWLASFAAKHGVSVAIPAEQPLLTYEQGYQAALADMEKLDADTTPAETLEELREIAIRAYLDCAEPDAGCNVDAMQAAVTAILRAAKPVVDVAEHELSAEWRKADDGALASWRRIIDLCNSRIRYTVALPEPDISVTVVAGYEAGYRAAIHDARNALDSLKGGA